MQYSNIDLGYSIASSYADQRATQTQVNTWIADMDALITDLSAVAASSTGRDYIIKMGVKLTYMGYEQLRLANGATNISGTISAQFAQLTEQWNMFFKLCSNLKTRNITQYGGLATSDLSDVEGW